MKKNKKKKTKKKENEIENAKTSSLEFMLSLANPETQKEKLYEENIIDKLLKAKDLFEVNLISLVKFKIGCLKSKMNWMKKIGLF